MTPKSLAFGKQDFSEGGLAPRERIVPCSASSAGAGAEACSMLRQGRASMEACSMPPSQLDEAADGVCSCSCRRGCSFIASSRLSFRPSRGRIRVPCAARGAPGRRAARPPAPRPSPLAGSSATQLGRRDREARTTENRAPKHESSAKTCEYILRIERQNMRIYLIKAFVLLFIS